MKWIYWERYTFHRQNANHLQRRKGPQVMGPSWKARAVMGEIHRVWAISEGKRPESIINIYRTLRHCTHETRIWCYIEIFKQKVLKIKNIQGLHLDAQPWLWGQQENRSHVSQWLLQVSGLQHQTAWRVADMWPIVLCAVTAPNTSSKNLKVIVEKAAHLAI